MKTTVGVRFAVAGANLKFAACKVLEPPLQAVHQDGFVHTANEARLIGINVLWCRNRRFCKRG